jgi:hypothetical protein
MKRLFLAAILAIAAAPAFAQNLTFTLETSSPDGKVVAPRLTWSTTPAATSCTASGATDWTGAKAAAGTVVLAGVNTSRTYGIACQWPGVTKAAVTWTAPTTNTDGSAYTNPAGFRIQYGNTGGTEAQLSTSAYLTDPAARSWTSPDLTPGTWYFAVKAVNTLGLESAISNIASKTTTAAANQNRALELTIRFPSAIAITVE